VPGPTAHDIFDLDRPYLDWVAMAAGMGVEGIRVDTAEQFNTALAAGFSNSGPMLIEAMV
jgi:acetolactate synthase-1/2/3 large subunit